MKLLDLTVLSPEPNPDNPQEKKVVHRDINVNADLIYFAMKLPLQQHTKIVTPQAEINALNATDSMFEDVGLVSCEAAEGVTAWFNPNHVLFKLNPELGVYILVFENGTQLALRTTGVELDQKLGVSGGLIT